MKKLDSKFYILDNLHVLKLSGEKAFQLAQGQITCDLKNIQTGSTQYGLLLSRKGKVEADFWTFIENENVYFIANQQKTQHLKTHMEKYAPLSRVEVELIENCVVFHVLGELDCTQKNLTANYVLASNRLQLYGWDIITTNENKDQVTQQLQSQLSHQLSAEQWETIRIEQGIPQEGKDFDENNLPQESRLDRAISYTKGCYLGQEIIARLHYKGHVNKILVGLVCEDRNPVNVHSPLILDENQVGVITSSAFSDKLQKTICLGYVPYKLNESSQKFKNDQGRIFKIIELPLNSQGDD